MKPIIRRAVSCVLFAGLLVAAIAKCSDLLEYKEARKKYIPFYESATNFDVIFLGTSHMWNHVLPMEMWKDYGIASYNWGYSNCTPAENYYLIQDILKYTSPKVVVIDVFGLVEYDDYDNGKYRTDRIEQQHVQFDSLPIWSKSKIEASKDVFDNYENNEYFIWNFIMYHNRWTELGRDDFEYDITTEKGSLFLTGLGKASFTPIPETEKIDIDSVCYPYYLKIIEYCQKQGIDVLCAFIPYAAREKQQKIANTIGDVVEEYPNCSYVNMLTKNILNFNTDVCPDNVHLNYSGADKVTNWLGQYLKDNFNLDDYSMDSSWNNDYISYQMYKQEVLKSQSSLAAYLVQLEDDDFIADAEIYNKSLIENERLAALFNNADIVPAYVENDTDKCARLVIKNRTTGEILEDVYFVCGAAENIDILTINKSKE